MFVFVRVTQKFISQIFRALRLLVDTGLHFKGEKRDAVLSLFYDYFWESSDMVRKEVTRYQSVFGQATAYMVGKLHIEELRRYAKEKLGKKFNLKEFHYEILSQGSVPLDYMTSHVHEYVKCALDDKSGSCTTMEKGKNRITESVSSTEYSKELASENQRKTQYLYY